MHKKVYCFDIDGTLCTNTEGRYEDALPMTDRIGKLNALFDEGHTIVLFTARGSTTGIDWRDTTEGQMERWGVKYHKLLLGKPYADVYIDDKAVNDKDWFDV
ncbi:MAG: hypothetical protein K2X98_02880 [Alphaproteobacteria bacterium]|nr:hypothetical protein [Alphaproteobacteria bacterium]